ncbi:MAG: tetratricopeptide repeat protein [Deltaproteobacteria bacterium]|nr:tetratricopeptide repeat protein [Deltaproteobacteria bacterium]
MTTAQDAAATLDVSMPAAVAHAGVWRRGLVAALLVAAVAVAFGNALQNEFVYDDRLLIVDNRAVGAPLDDLQALGSYRPLRTLSYRLDYAIGGLDPRVFHLGNLVYHAVTVLLVRAVVERAGASPWAAAAGALLFAVHPVQTDAVTYAAGRRDILCGLFFAAGFLAYLHYRERKSRVALMMALTSYVLAILAKEMALTLPIVCFVYERFAMARAGAPSTRATRREQMGRSRLFAVLAVVGVLVAGAAYGRFVRRVVEVTPWHGGTPGANLATVLRIWTRYLYLIVWPARLSADYSYRAFPVSTALLDGRALAAAVLLAALALAAWWRWRRGDLAGFGAAWCAVTLLPVSHIIPYRELLAEHYLYVPMIGVACVVAGAIDAAGTRASLRRLVLAAVVLVALAAAARTIVRNRDWRDTQRLWSATVATVPDCARARFNLGQAYFERVRFDDAEREWLAAVAITPNDLDTLVALAMLYYRQGRFDAAERWVTAALAGSADDVRVLNLAGWVALDAGDAARALPRFDAALAHVPTAGEGGRLAGERAAAAAGARLGREQATAALVPPPAPARARP